MSGYVGCETLSPGDFILGPEGWCPDALTAIAGGCMAPRHMVGIQCVVYHDGCLWIATGAGPSDDASTEWWTRDVGGGVIDPD